MNLSCLQKRAIQANQGKMVNTSCALIVNKSIQDLEASISQLRIEEIMDEEPEAEATETVEEQVEDEFYTLEELDAMENTSYAFHGKEVSKYKIQEKAAIQSQISKATIQ